MTEMKIQNTGKKKLERDWGAETGKQKMMLKNKEGGERERKNKNKKYTG